MNEHHSLKTAYTFFVGLLLAIFVGVGVQAFYSAPKFPDYPTYGYTEQPTAEEKKAQEEFDKKIKEHDEKSKPYSRNVSLITMGAAIVFLSIGVVFDKKLKIIANGFMIGGILTLIYSIGRSFAADNYTYTFGAVSAGLVIALALGYWQFLRPKPTTKKK